MSPVPSAKRPGFTVVELIIVIAIFTVVVAGTAPLLVQFQHKQKVGNVAEDVVQALRKAEHRSLVGERDSGWGVSFQTGQYVVFAGSSYAARITDFDERRTVATPEYAFSGSGELVFQRGTGKPLVPGTVSVTHFNGLIRRVSVGSNGSITLL